MMRREFYDRQYGGDEQFVRNKMMRAQDSQEKTEHDLQTEDEPPMIDSPVALSSI